MSTTYSVRRLGTEVVAVAVAPIGAWPAEGGFAFRVFAPAVREVTLRLEGPRSRGDFRLERAPDGHHQGLVPGLAAGTLYRYVVDGRGPFPDPASRAQPQGVHGPSATVDPRAFGWTDARWRGPARERLVIYEVHVGTVTARGTFDALGAKLGALARLGVTAIELMPVADCPGARNWGYDGVSIYAPAHRYGGPEGLRRLVDRAHAQGLAVILDVVYNHLGPDGNYLGVYSDRYFTSSHATPWGQAVAFGEPGSRPVRDFFVHNALQWIQDYHVDGLRLDATHAIVDGGPEHILAELRRRVRATRTRGRSALLIAEDSSNDPRLVTAPSRGGHGLDAVWADDFHHQVRVIAAGDDDGYYRDYASRMDDLARTLRDGWLYTGQWSRHWGRPRGGSPAGLPAAAMVHALQNHDQVGNRAMGDRLHHRVGLDTWRALSTLLLTSPYVPLLFMGQEWAATAPFCYFTDHEPGLGAAVTAGRRKEFGSFKGFRSPRARRRIPDPQSEATFLASKLDWAERRRRPHSGVLALHRDLLGLRARAPALARATRRGFDVRCVGPWAIAVRRTSRGQSLLVILHLRGRLELALEPADRVNRGRRWRRVLSSEDARYGGEPSRARIDAGGRSIVLRGPVAVVLEACTPGDAATTHVGRSAS